MIGQARDTLENWGGTVAGGKDRGDGTGLPGRRLRMSGDFVVSSNVQPISVPVRLSPVARAALMVTRLVLPVMALLLAFAAAYLYSDSHISFLDGLFAPNNPARPSAWLTWGHALLPASFFAVHLANRRYGPNYAMAQIVLACCLIAGLDVAHVAFPGAGVMPTLPVREGTAFGIAFFVALVVATAVFDRMRGIHWWHAPLFGSLWAALVFVAVFYPAAYAGTGAHWLSAAATHLGVMAVAGLALLIPYWILRPLVQPLPGFGGY